jgi:hypothetical protein
VATKLKRELPLKLQSVATPNREKVPLFFLCGNKITILLPPLRVKFSGSFFQLCLALATLMLCFVATPSLATLMLCFVATPSLATLMLCFVATPLC